MSGVRKRVQNGIDFKDPTGRYTTALSDTGTVLNDPDPINVLVIKLDGVIQSVHYSNRDLVSAMKKIYPLKSWIPI